MTCQAEINRIDFKCFGQKNYLIAADNQDQVYVFDIDLLDLDSPTTFRPLFHLKYSPVTRATGSPSSTYSLAGKAPGLLT